MTAPTLLLLPLLLAAPQDTGPILFPLEPPLATAVQFTVRVCEGGDGLRFWFNDEAEARWNECPRPLAGVPIIFVATSGQRAEVRTRPDGTTDIAEVNLSHGETFRIGMACTTHRCLSLHELGLGTPLVRAGNNRLLVETAPVPGGGASPPSPGSEPE